MQTLIQIHAGSSHLEKYALPEHCAGKRMEKDPSAPLSVGGSSGQWGSWKREGVEMRSRKAVVVINVS